MIYRSRVSFLLLIGMIMLSMVLTPLSTIAQDNKEETNDDLFTPVTESVESDVVENSETTIDENVNVDEETEAEEVTETITPEQPEAETETEEVKSSEEPIVEEVEKEATPEKEGIESEEIVEEFSEETEESEASAQSISIIPMAIATPGFYTIDPNSIVVPVAIKGVSTNNHTLSKLVWANGNTVYAMIQSTHELVSMTLNGSLSTNMDQYNAKVAVTVGGTKYDDPGKGLKGNVDDAHWTVFKFNIADLKLDGSGEYPLSIVGIGGGHDIKNAKLEFTIPQIDVVGKKVWIGGTERPSITLQLKGTPEAGGVLVTKDAVVNGSESPTWTHTWLKVPKYDPVGRLYTYTVDELTVPPNYVKTINGLTVTNTYSPSQFNIDVSKVWIGPAADSVTIKLFADGFDTGKTLVLNKGNNWSGSFANLNKLDDITGNTITYAVEEVKITGYSTVKTGEEKNGSITFANTNDEKISIDVEKKWVGKVGDSVDVKLLAEGVDTGRSVNLNKDNEWKSSFPGLRKFDATTGKEITYSIEEVVVQNGYEASYDTGENGQLIVTNTAIIGSITVKKVDGNDAPLDGAVFELQDQNGIVIATGTTVDGGILFPDLELGDYFLVETKAPDGYRKLVSKIAVTISTDDLYVVKTVENTKIDWVIPATGGIGTSLFYGIGALLMISTLILYLRRKKA